MSQRLGRLLSTLVLPFSLVPTTAAVTASSAAAAGASITTVATSPAIRAQTDRHKVQIRFSLVPAYADPGQSVVLKGRVTGVRKAVHVKIHVSGLPTIKKKTKRSGKFHVGVTVPVDRRIEACVGKRCKTAQVPPVPDAINTSWANSEGYSFRSTTIGLAVTNVVVDVASAPPGDANISLGISGDEAITNTTPGHDAPVDRTFLVPVFPASSTLCQATTESAGNTLWATVPLHQSTGDPNAPSDPVIPYCSFRFPPNDGPISGTIPAGQTAHNNFAETAPGYPYRLTITVPQGQAQTIASDLSHPAFWALSLGTTSGEYPAGVCYGVVPFLATSRGGLTVCSQGAH